MSRRDDHSASRRVDVLLVEAPHLIDGELERRAGRPPLPRWRVPVVVELELGADTIETACARAGSLGRLLPELLTGSSRFTRHAGSPTVVGVEPDGPVRVRP